MSAEDDQFFILTRPDGEEIEANRHNTALYTFIGSQLIDDVEVDISAYDHIFVATNMNEEGQVVGSFIWQSDDIFEEFKKKLRYNEWPQYVNMPLVQESDLEAFDHRHFSDEDVSTFPEAWVDLPGEADERAA